MNRLAKKCVIASSIMHGTLVVLLLVGPAFLSSDEVLDAKQIIDFIPFKTLETSMSGGGNPNVEQVIPPTPPRQEAPKPAPQPQPREPDPAPRRSDPKPAEPVKPAPTPEPSREESGWRPSDRIKVNLNQTTRTSTDRTASTTPSTSRNSARSQSIDTAINKIQSSASGSVNVELRGPGGGGIPYAGFNDALISAYMRAWSITTDLAKLRATVTISVTIQRDGTVISSKIQRRSGNSELDASVQSALDRVTKVGPFPDSVKDAQKTFWLEFDPQLKPMTG